MSCVVPFTISDTNKDIKRVDFYMGIGVYSRCTT